MPRPITHDAHAPVLHRVRTLTPFARFAYYMRTRYQAAQQRLIVGATPPFTDDPIIARYKFTNVRRAWDRTSRWLTQHWYHRNTTKPTVGLACATARFICHPATLSAIHFPTEPLARWFQTAKVTMRLRQQNRQQVFTGAYIISAAGSEKGIIKSDYVVDAYLRPAWDSGLLALIRRRSAMELHEQLVQLKGWGHFMTQEVILDLMDTRILAECTDRKDYAYAGPGAIRGLRRAFTHARQWKPTQDVAREMMQTLRTYMQQHHQHGEWKGFIRSLTLHDIEFNLCEFDKYERALWNESTPKAIFHWRSNA